MDLVRDMYYIQSVYWIININEYIEIFKMKTKYLKLLDLLFKGTALKMTTSLIILHSHQGNSIESLQHKSLEFKVLNLITVED